MTNIDWNRARAFLATAETGSLSAAARSLGLTQPTLSRQVARLEADLDVTLFERVGKKLELTETGESLLEHVRAMGEAALAMTFAASGRAEKVAGRVSISATDTYAAFILPEIIERIRREVPQITVAVISSDNLSDLRRREADIAIRHVRPEEEGLIGRLVCESTAHFYASESWVARQGHPGTVSEIAPYEFVGYEDAERFAAFLRSMGAGIDSEDFRLVSKNSVVIWELVRRGHGVGLMSREIAERASGMVELFPELEAARFPVWLVTHRELHTSKRIRLVYDILGQELGRITREARKSTVEMPVWGT
jgi:DNA-binding transcriptional LysR family regulator